MTTGMGLTDRLKRALQTLANGYTRSQAGHRDQAVENGPLTGPLRTSGPANVRRLKGCAARLDEGSQAQAPGRCAWLGGQNAVLLGKLRDAVSAFGSQHPLCVSYSY